KLNCSILRMGDHIGPPHTEPLLLGRPYVASHYKRHVMSVTTAATIPKEEAKRQLSLRTIEIRWGFLFLLPWIIGFLLFTAGPMLGSLYLSFTDYNITSKTGPAWIGTKNFSDILGLEIRALKNPTQNASEVLDHNFAELGRAGN